MDGIRAHRAPGRTVLPQGRVQDVTPPWAVARLAGPRQAPAYAQSSPLRRISMR